MDCKLLVDVLVSGSLQNNELGALLMDYLMLSSHFLVCSWSFVHRSGNVPVKMSSCRFGLRMFRLLSPFSLLMYPLISSMKILIIKK